MKIVEIVEEDKIVFDNGYTLEQYHSQDCCEHVYADFNVLDNYNLSTVTGKTINIRDIDFEERIENLIQPVQNAGFNMVSKIGEKFFIPCYNEQNGYYSSDLELILRRLVSFGNVEEKIDISDCVKDEIF